MGRGNCLATDRASCFYNVFLQNMWSMHVTIHVYVCIYMHLYIDADYYSLKNYTTHVYLYTCIDRYRRPLGLPIKGLKESETNLLALLVLSRE